MRTNEQIISGFLRTEYTDEKLAALLAHSEDGRLAFFSCCCFAGLPSATHALRGVALAEFEILRGMAEGHDKDLDEALPWFQMSNAFCGLGIDDEVRRAKLIPLIKAEMDRREAEKSIESNSLSPVYAV